ncbi:MAG: hypothetical protein ABSB49_06765 [Polyangia bacterium]|jgi:hypothetical protein
MTKDTLIHALQAERIEIGDGSAIAVPEEREATLLVAGPGEIMQVGKVVRVEAREAALCIETAKGERLWLTYDLVLGLKLRNGNLAKDQPAGFGRFST